MMQHRGGAKLISAALLYHPARKMCAIIFREGAVNKLRSRFPEIRTLQCYPRQAHFCIHLVTRRRAVKYTEARLAPAVRLVYIAGGGAQTAKRRPLRFGRCATEPPVSPVSRSDCKLNTPSGATHYDVASCLLTSRVSASGWTHACKNGTDREQTLMPGVLKYAGVVRLDYLENKHRGGRQRWRMENVANLEVRRGAIFAQFS